MANDIKAPPTVKVGPSSTLLRVIRDGNPSRSHGFASPFLGKIGPLDSSRLDALIRTAADSLPTSHGRSLVIGLTESSLVLAWGLVGQLPGAADLGFTTRRALQGAEVRTFQEPHSHGPRHFLALRLGVTYERIVIVEDEVTTGVTVANLILALRDVAGRFSVLSLTDLRTVDQKARWAVRFADLGIEVEFSRIRSRPSRLSSEQSKSRRSPNPYQRDRADLAASLRSLRRSWRNDRPESLYVIGECMDVGLAFWMALPAGDRPVFRHVTRSPWRVDGRVIFSRLDLGGSEAPVRHYLYNEEESPTDRALILGDTSTRRVAEDLGSHLRGKGIVPRMIEVPLR